MPALIAHSVVALNALEKLDNKELKNAIEQHRALFLLSAQGPDVYFYHGVLSFVGGNRTSLNKVGSIMHKNKPADSIEGLRNYFFNNLINENKDYALTVLAGFLCHYALDKNAHPYVYYLQRKLESQKNHGHMHARVESSLDSWLLKDDDLAGLQKEIFSLTEAEKRHYFMIFANVGSNVLQQEVSPEDIEVAFNTMKKATGMFYSRRVYWRWPVALVRTLPFGFAGKSEYFIPRNPVGTFDYLNEKRAEWFNTKDSSIVSTNRFKDILEEASEEAAELISLLCDEGMPEASVWDITKNISFDSGLVVKNTL